jgi:hypothetical protein
MRHLNKKLAMTAAATALIGAIGVTFAQTDTNDKTDPMATPQQVEVDGSSSQPIYFFRDQGNSPETDPAAHLMLIKHNHMHAVPVAESSTTTTTVVAEASTPADTTTTAMPAASDTSNTDTSTVAAPVDTTPALAPKADRN